MYRKNDIYLDGLSDVRASSPAGPFFFVFRSWFPASGNKNYFAAARLANQILKYTFSPFYVYPLANPPN